MNQTSNWIRLFILSLVWGGSFIFIEIALRGFLPFTLVWIRVSLAAAVLFAVAIARGESIPRDLRTWGGFLCIGLLSNVIPFSLITWAQQHITAGTASILNATVPLWVVVASLFFGIGTRPTKVQLVGVVIGFLGVILLIAPKMNGGFSPARTSELCVLMAAIAYAIGALYGKRFSATSPIVNAAGMCTCSAIILTPVAIFWEGTASIGLDLSAWGAVFALAVASTAFAYLLYFKILRSAEPAFLSLVTYLIPVFAMTLGIVFLNETISLTSIAGVAVIFLGLLILDGRLMRLLTKRKNSEESSRV